MKNKALFPDPYPTDLNECLLLFEKFTYKSCGFGVISLYYNYSFKYWSMVFRNPENFKSPEIKAKTPTEACHEMLDFLKPIHKKKS